MPNAWLFEYSTSSSLLFGILVLYRLLTLKIFYNMNKKLLIGLLALGVAMIVAGLVIVFVGLP
jgi:hypothetical protein